MIRYGNTHKNKIGVLQKWLKNTRMKDYGFSSFKEMVFLGDVTVFNLDFGEEHEDEDDTGWFGIVRVSVQVKVKFGDFRWRTKGSYEFSHERVTCGLSGQENDVAGTCEGHVRAKSAGDDVAVSREGSRGYKWDTLAF